MCKGVGLVVICASCILFGLSYKLRFRKEVQLIGLFQNILVELQEEIVYGKYPLAECFYRIGERKKGEVCELFCGVYEACMETAMHPMEVFQTHVKRYLLQEGMSPKLIEQVTECIVMGNMEKDMQYRLLQQSAQHLRQLYEAKERERGDKEKLAMTMGVMGSCFFFLFLI